MDIQGFNGNIPPKVKVIEHLNGLGQSTALMGEVNCVVRRDGQWIGENTEGKGFVSSLDKLTDLNRKKVVIFGDGGAARGNQHGHGPVPATLPSSIVRSSGVKN